MYLHVYKSVTISVLHPLTLGPLAPTGKTVSPPHRRLSPVPMPPGYHHHQYPSTEVPPSRPMTPGEQFGRIGIHDRWLAEREGEPSENDIKVKKISRIE